MRYAMIIRQYENNIGMLLGITLVYYQQEKMNNKTLKFVERSGTQVGIECFFSFPYTHFTHIYGLKT